MPPVQKRNTPKPESQPATEPILENPLTDTPVVERDYTNYKTTQPLDVNPIPEAPVSRPTFEAADSQFRESVNEEMMDDQPKGRPVPPPTMPQDVGGEKKGMDRPSGGSKFNPAMENLDKKSQKNGAEQMVDAVLDGYGLLCGWAGKLAAIPEGKIAKLVRDGKIDPNLEIPIDVNESITLQQYVQTYNEQTAGVLDVSPDFKKKVKPVMTRVFMKHNIGMTDEQLLLYYFGTDMISKGATIYGLRKQNQKMMEIWQEMTSQIRTAQGPTAGFSSQPADKGPDNPSGRGPVQEPVIRKEEEAPKREYVEPEEQAANAPVTQDTEEFSIANVTKQEQYDFAEVKVVKPQSPFVTSNEMPTFGDVHTLSAMEKIGKSEAKKKGRTIIDPNEE